MALLTKLPGDLSLKFVQGDQMQINCDFDLNVTGYTITNVIYVKQVFASGGGGSGFVSTVGATVTAFEQTILNASQGTLLLDLPENKSSMLTPANGYRWYLRWVDTGGITRTVLSGDVTVVSP